MRLIAMTIILCFATSIMAKAEGSGSPLVPLKSKTYPYLAYLPSDYNKNDTKAWPLIIYLHGSSCKGNNLEKLKKYGPPFYLERGMQVDAIVISPQCPSNKNWTVGTWFESFYNELKEKYHIDPSRVYLTGMSLGGFGTWDLASRYPEYFAAIMPLCGGGKTSMVETLKDIPTWVFHGEVDKKVKLQRSKEMVKAMQDVGSDPKFSVLKGQGHGIQKVYSDQTIYDWLLSHQKKAYERILEVASFWTPKIDSVSTEKKDDRNSLVTKIFPMPETLMDRKKSNDKFSLLDLFSRKPIYTQQTLH
jgi:pimeloyl-ACP methyl ester carboxylesterase